MVTDTLHQCNAVLLFFHQNKKRLQTLEDILQNTRQKYCS